MDTTDTWLIILTTAYVILTAIIAFLTFQIVRLNSRMVGVNDRLVWFTGSMESYSAQMLKIEAKRESIKTLWWDPSEEDWPRTGPHGADIDVDVLRIGMHPRDRKVTPQSWA